jgi:hypothetical protein
LEKPPPALFFTECGSSANEKVVDELVGKVPLFESYADPGDKDRD